MEHRSKSERKRIRKLMPKLTKQWSRVPLGAPQIGPKSTSNHSGRSKDVPGASRDVPAAPRERPKGAPGEARNAFGEPEKAIRRQISTIWDRDVVQFREILVEIRRSRSNVRSDQGLRSNFVKFWWNFRRFRQSRSSWNRVHYGEITRCRGLGANARTVDARHRKNKKSGPDFDKKSSNFVNVRQFWTKIVGFLYKFDQFWTKFDEFKSNVRSGQGSRSNLVEFRSNFGQFWTNQKV